MNRSLILIFTLMIAISSCLPTSPKSNRRNTSNNSSAGAVNTTSAAPPSTFPAAKYWFSGTTNVETITLNTDTQTVIYLRGSEIHNFLDSVAYYDNTLQKNIYQYDKSFCIVANYEINTVKTHLRARAVPIDFYNFSTGTKERLFRIDIPKEDDNTSGCQSQILLR